MRCGASTLPAPRQQTGSIKANYPRSFPNFAIRAHIDRLFLTNFFRPSKGGVTKGPASIAYYGRPWGLLVRSSRRVWRMALGSAVGNSSIIPVLTIAAALPMARPSLLEFLASKGKPRGPGLLPPQVNTIGTGIF